MNAEEQTCFVPRLQVVLGTVGHAVSGGAMCVLIHVHSQSTLYEKGTVSEVFL